MQLLSKGDYLVWVPGDSIKKVTKRLGHCTGVWVAYNERGEVVGHTPYQQDEGIREIVLKLAKAKMLRFNHGG
jgi:antitoxin component YwqK of YwqJK toxin-antitoxin module